MRKAILLTLLAVTIGLGPQLAAGHSNHWSNSNQEILDWNEMALDTVRTKSLGAFPAARVYAMVNVAMYDAVNGISVARGWSNRSVAMVSAYGAPSNASRRASAMAAAHAVLSALHPDLASNYDAELANGLAALNSSYDIDAGRNWGAYIGQQVAALRANDGSSPSETQPGGNGPGEFRADWGSAQYRNMAPFGVNDPSAFLSFGPPPLDSPDYAAALNEVKLLGNGAIPDLNKEEIFRFWRAGGGSARPPGEWIKIAIAVASTHDATRHSISKTARLFALLGMALGDSAITSTDSKFTYHFWRPTTAVQNADTDGNSETQADPTWAPRNGSIGGSPEHTSGQSTFAAAGATVLAQFFCNDDISFAFTGDNAIAGARSFDSFSQAAAEAGRARIFAGIHFEFSNQAGQKAGRGVAKEILANKLLVNHGSTHFGSCPR